MTTLNKAARDCMVRYEVHACTDVTGFGFLGHAYEMAQGSGVQLEIDTSAVDTLPAALEFAKMGLLPEGMYRNRHYAEAAVDPGEVPLEVQDVLYDPQTAGGLLMGRGPPGTPTALYRDLQGAVPSAQRVGVVRPETEGGQADHSAVTARMAARAASISASLVNQPVENRTVPRGKVPSVLWAAGAQCSPHRVRMPNWVSSV